MGRRERVLVDESLVRRKKEGKKKTGRGGWWWGVKVCIELQAVHGVYTGAGPPEVAVTQMPGPSLFLQMYHMYVHYIHVNGSSQRSSGSSTSVIHAHVQTFLFCKWYMIALGT